MSKEKAKPAGQYHQLHPAHRFLTHMALGRSVGALGDMVFPGAGHAVLWGATGAGAASGAIAAYRQKKNSKAVPPKEHTKKAGSMLYSSYINELEKIAEEQKKETEEAHRHAQNKRKIENVDLAANTAIAGTAGHFLYKRLANQRHASSSAKDARNEQLYAHHHLRGDPHSENIITQIARKSYDKARDISRAVSEHNEDLSQYLPHLGVVGASYGSMLAARRLYRDKKK